MPEQPAGPPAHQTGDHRPRPAWSVALQIAAAAVVAAILIAGPQIWTFGERLRDFRGRASIAFPKRPAAATKAPVGAPVPAAIRVAPAPPALVRTAANRPGPGRPQVRTATARPGKKARRAPVPGQVSAQILLEPRQNPRVYFETLMREGHELYQKGWYGPAMGRFRQAAAVMPSTSAHLWVGRAAIRAGRYAEARHALERVIAMAPDSPAAREAFALLDRLKADTPS